MPAPIIDYLNLSNRMVEMLIQFRRNNFMCAYSHYVTTANALQNRGLVRFLDPGFELTNRGKMIADIILDE